MWRRCKNGLKRGILGTKARGNNETVVSLHASKLRLFDKTDNAASERG